MKRDVNLIESKNINAGETLFDKKLNDNLLLFVFSGNLTVSNNKLNQEIEEGHFILLAANTSYAVKAVLNSHLLLIHTENLAEAIIEDPEWNPENPLVLPIPSVLADVLSEIEYNKKENRELLN